MGHRVKNQRRNGNCGRVKAGLQVLASLIVLVSVSLAIVARELDVYEGRLITAIEIVFEGSPT